MPTVQEILKQSGFTDEEIAGLQPKAITAFSGVLTTAEQERQQAEAARRANADLYDNQIAPSLVQWEEEKTRITQDNARIAAENAYHRTRDRQLRAAGIIPDDAPSFQPGRDGQGRYVAGGGGTPGSPTFVPPSGGDDIDTKLGNGLSNVAWALQTHQQLTGNYLPDSFDKLATEATVARMPFRDYVSRKYNYEGLRQEAQRKAQEKHDADLVAKTKADTNREWAEKTGSNPDVRRPEDSRWGSTTRAQKAGLIPDPLSLNEEQRRMATRAMIRKDISEQASE
jgi:hypothetical protein